MLLIIGLISAVWATVSKSEDDYYEYYDFSNETESKFFHVIDNVFGIDKYDIDEETFQFSDSPITENSTETNEIRVNFTISNDTKPTRPSIWNSTTIKTTTALHTPIFITPIPTTRTPLPYKNISKIRNSTKQNVNVINGTGIPSTTEPTKNRSSKRSLHILMDIFLLLNLYGISYVYCN